MLTSLAASELITGASLFPLAAYWWFYAAFTALVLLLLAADLGIFHRRVHAIGFREAAVWTAVWITLALLFSFWLYQYAGTRFGQQAAKKVTLEFLTGYIVEWSLSLDNMFVFVVVFAYFAIPAELQHRVLFYGILGALVFRAAFISLGSALLQYGWVAVLFGAFLILTGIRMMFSPERQVEPEKSLMIRALRKVLPVTPNFVGRRFFTNVQGRPYATPLLLTLAFVEASDILFAIDSVPAIFAITKEPLIVYTSNVFAILGLRSMYFLLAGAVRQFHFLRYGLAVILMFVGLKMSWLNTAWHGHFPTGVSLAVISGVLAVSIGLSLLFPPRDGGAV
jgi:tellurite resistance protein TerC